MKIEIDVTMLAERLVWEAESRMGAVVELRTGPYGGAISAIRQEDESGETIFLLFEGEVRTLNWAKAFKDRVRLVKAVEELLFDLLRVALCENFDGKHMMASWAAFDAVEGGAECK
jgi:hypothetical protein